MPPLGEKLIEAPQQLTEEELVQKAEIHRIEQELYGVIQELVPIPTTRSRTERFLRLRYPNQTAVATYSLPGEPELRKMDAWVERFYEGPRAGRVILRTRVVEKVDGQIVRAKNIHDRAWAVNGGLHGWKNGAYRDLTHDEQLGVLNDIGDTLELIANVDRASKEQ